MHGVDNLLDFTGHPETYIYNARTDLSLEFFCAVVITRGPIFRVWASLETRLFFLGTRLGLGNCAAQPFVLGVG